MEAIKLCRLDTPIIFIEARINLSRFVVIFCTAKTSATVSTLSLHDALPISRATGCDYDYDGFGGGPFANLDRKSTRLNSSHQITSYAVFCLKKKRIRQSFLSKRA